MLLALCVDVDGRESHGAPASFELVLPGQEIAALPSSVGRSFPIRGCRRQIVRVGVLADRTIRRKRRRQARHAFTHPRDPALGDAMRVADVECRTDLSFEQGVERIRLGRVP